MVPGSVACKDQGVLISPMNDVPGCRVTPVIGEVFGLFGSPMGAGFTSLVGGERQGVIAMRFDPSRLGGNGTELCAGGTAVGVAPG